MIGVLAALLLALCGSASAAPVTLGGQVGVLAWQKAASPAPLLHLGLAVDSQVARRLSVGAELSGGRMSERNGVTTLTTWPLRASATADVVLTRQTLGLRLGAGPALVVAPTRVAGEDRVYSGVYARPGLRLRGVIDGAIRGRVGWRAQGGAVARQAGMDWDGSVALTVKVGGGS